jgi:hypothetical protein
VYVHDRRREPAPSAMADEIVGMHGQAIAERLFSVGLDLDYALTMAGDGPGAIRLRQAAAELDQAVLDLRFLMISLSRTGGTTG